MHNLLVSRFGVGFQNYVLQGLLTAVTVSLPLVTFSTQPAPSAHAQDATATEAFKLQGEYLKAGRGIQAAALAGDQFRVLFFQGGLPGEGWDRSPIQVVEMDLEELKELVAKAEKIVRKSPSLGAKPPATAIVLFDGSQASIDQHWQNGAKLVEENLLLAGVTSKDTFKDYRLHLEFRTPFVPQAMGQGRGNSGVYHQGRYETQVLDSFGFDNEGNTCGAIYGVKAADFNAGLPPMAWQTYDVEFVAARFDADGKKTSDAKLSVWLNGYPIHRDQKAPGETTAAPVREGKEPGPLYLQDHGNPVTYRNIWVVPMDADAAALRPRVPGYERLASQSSNTDSLVMSGQILVSELGCLSCHAAGQQNSLLEKKEAPILDQSGSRLRPGFVASMLADVHRSKTGTTMPDLLHGLDDVKKKETINAIAAYLEGTGKARRQSRIEPQAIERGKDLYAKIGCAVCHGNIDGSKITATSVPLPDLTKKYSFDGLALFLKQPHTVRPGNRMPGMHLNDNEVKDLASYLLPSVDPSDVRPNTNYQLFYGSWQKIPNFEEMKPEATGTCEGLDLTVSGKGGNYGIRFESFIAIDQAGKYRFHLRSDDGSKLYIDGKLLVDVDGIHPPQSGSGEIELQAGSHQVRVDFIQGGGGAELDLELESSTVVRQAIDAWLMLKPNQPKTTDGTNTPDAKLIETGKRLFQSVGCVQCHKMNGTDLATSSMAKAPSLDGAKPDSGCLASQPKAGVPDYKLTVFQKEAISAALSNKSSEPRSPAMHSKYLISKLNCIACHQRDDWGGPESDKLDLFTSTIPEMGDEGRLPPRLTGVADKLNDNYLIKVLAEGARQRPYMLVRMPQYGNATQGLADHWKTLDRPSEERVANGPDEAEIRTIAAGRQLSGTKGLSCAQCHAFGNERAIGIQAINLQTMTERLRPEWFYRYLLEPTKYRPGTRMPASFPEGVSVLKTVYDGNAEHQIAAMWKYLAQGSQAAAPEGLQRNQIVLEPTDKPIIYRNFLDGLSARGIAVGYPGGLNIAWDAESMNLAKVWQGQFIDASMHWRDRGVGRQKPLGDLVLPLESSAPVAILESVDTPWPNAKSVAEVYRFKGYTLDKAGTPTFKYMMEGIEITDRSELSQGLNDAPGLKRTLTVRPLVRSVPKGTVTLRLGDGNNIVKDGENTWKVDDKYQVTIPAALASKVSIRDASGKKELVLPIPATPAGSTIEYFVRW